MKLPGEWQHWYLARYNVAMNTIYSSAKGFERGFPILAHSSHKSQSHTRYRHVNSVPLQSWWYYLSLFSSEKLYFATFWLLIQYFEMNLKPLAERCTWFSIFLTSALKSTSVQFCKHKLSSVTWSQLNHQFWKMNRFWTNFFGSKHHNRYLFILLCNVDCNLTFNRIDFLPFLFVW